MCENTTNLLNVEGKSEVSYEYTDFGETEINGDENFYNEICYTGWIYDKKTGLYYLNARYYNPEDGRFLTEDTYRGEFTNPSGHIPVALIIDAEFGALDGYRYAKKKNLKGWKKAGALRSTQDGDVPIEDIEEGDLVWAQDSETGDITLKRVVQTFVKETDTILYIKVAGEVIEATEQHVFYIDNVGWIPASMIKEGDVVVFQSGDKSTVEKIDKVVHNELITVYNF